MIRVKQRLQDCDSSSGEDEVVVIKLQPKAKGGSSSDEEGVEMTLEKALQKAGYFGWFQIRFLLINLLYHIPAPFHILGIAFVGLAPKWTCETESENLHKSFLRNSTSTDHGNDCLLYEDGSANCTPQYTDRFYSISQEVCYWYYGFIDNQSSECTV